MILKIEIVTKQHFNCRRCVFLTWCWRCTAAFYKGWDMTLVILAATPVLAGVGIAIGIVMANLGKKASDAYAKASSIVAENLGNVRTVLAFNGADRAVKAYEGVRT